MIAVSTIGMTAYNFLTVAPRELTAAELYVATSRSLGAHIEQADFIAAMKVLIRKQYLFVNQCGDGPDRFSCFDQRRRRIRWRDRSPNSDGWGGWLAENPGGPPIPIEAVIRQQIKHDNARLAAG
jgi:hypothetical protein